MKILVAVKSVIDPSVPIRVASDGLSTEHLRKSMNAFDEVALEEAVRLRERGWASEVLAVSCSDDPQVLRTALAMGADHVRWVETLPGIQPLAVAKILCALVLQERPGLVLLGKLATDDGANQTSQLLAGLLNWNQATCISNLEPKAPDLIWVTREIDGGNELWSVPLPAVVSVDLRLNEPRYVTLPNLIKAKKQPIESVPFDQLGDVEVGDRLEVVKVATPKPRSKGVLVPNVDALLQELRARFSENGGRRS